MMVDGFDGIYTALSPCARRALNCAGSRKVICSLVMCHLILFHLHVRTLLCLQNMSLQYPFIHCEFHSNIYPTSDRCTGTLLKLCLSKQSWPKLDIVSVFTQRTEVNHGNIKSWQSMFQPGFEMDTPTSTSLERCCYTKAHFLIR